MLTLTPQAKAIAVFALGAMLVLGSLNRVGLSVATVLNEIDSLSAKGASVVVTLVSTAIGVALLVLANQAVTRLDQGWAHGLAQAAVLLAVIGTAISLLDLIAAVAGDGFGAGFYSRIP